MKKIESNITYNHLLDELQNPPAQNKTTLALFIGEELLILGLCAIMFMMF